MKLRILVIGSGGREHAIAQRCLLSPNVVEVFCAKGNPGMKKEGIQLVDIDEDDYPSLIQFVKDKKIDWTFVGPEIPLIDGIVDAFQAEGLLIFGPSKAAAMIEGSKDFAKNFMKKYRIPTANYQTFCNFQKAKKFVEQKGVPIVIKADGLAAGKGVVVANTLNQAIKALQEMLEENKFGESGAKVVIEEFLEGEEFSLMAFVSGKDVYPMVAAQDHKRAYDGDRGLNTGGMGAYSPVPQISNQLIQESIQNVLLPTAKALHEEGCSFTGILYAGLIATHSGVKTIEFNARFGDPETQVVLQRLESDFAQIIDDLLREKKPDVCFKQEGYSLGVVVAAEGYPENYKIDCPVPDIELVTDMQVYYAGVKELQGQLVSSGGRVYLIEATAQTLEGAREAVYTQLGQMNTTNTFYRKDIGEKGLEQ